MVGTNQIDDKRTTETIYVFEEKRVIHSKQENKIQNAIESGEFKTHNISVSYAIRTINGTRCLVLGETKSTYPLRLIAKDMDAIKRTLFHIATKKEKLKIMQASQKPDFGYEVAAIQKTPIVIKQGPAEKSIRRINIM
jgi:hypothetical protein